MQDIQIIQKLTIEHYLNILIMENFSLTSNQVNVAITNNGTIAATGSEGAYALYFGSGATCTLNNHGTITGSNFGKVTVSE